MESTDDVPLSRTEQACNECKRRKTRCDRGLPQCLPCQRNRRHCLYDRYKRAPLTRIYLTELESRLERAEQRAQLAEERALAAERHQQYESVASPAASRARSQTAGTSRPPTGVGPDGRSPEDGSFAMPAFISGQQQPQSAPGLDRDHSARAATNLYREQPENDAFSWNEDTESMTSPNDVSSSPNHIPVPAPAPADGMATLAVQEHGHGYLGSPSGAAMLRMLLSSGRWANVPLPLANDRSRAAPATPHIQSPAQDSMTLDSLDLDSAIDAYFSTYHLNYPIVHEPTFRAQFSCIIPRPDETCFNALIYIIATIGLFTLSNNPNGKDHGRLFSAAKAELKIGFLERGNLTLVQVLALMSNYTQKCNRPNSGWNYLGLALHMAMGLGLHKEITVKGNGSTLHSEIRRRIWWTLHNFYVGAAITFGRPSAWPDHIVQVKLPLNIFDRDLTSMSKNLPSARQTLTTYSLLLMQAKFHQATTPIYHLLLSEDNLSASRLLELEKAHIDSWFASLPEWYREDAEIPQKFRLGQKIMFWRLRNFRLIMYRPFIFNYFYNGNTRPSAESHVAIRCLEEAEASIASIHSFWLQGPKSVLGAWYALYFLFQACLVPCAIITLANGDQITTRIYKSVDMALATMNSLQEYSPASESCAHTLRQLSGRVPSPRRRSLAVGGSAMEMSTNEIDERLGPSNGPGNLAIDSSVQDLAWFEFFQSAMDGSDNDFNELTTWSWVPGH